MNVAEARELVIEHLRNRFPSDHLMIQDDHTIEFDDGWMFFYNSAEYVTTGDPSERLFGNAPIIVNKAGRLSLTGTRYRSAAFSEAYRALGPDRFDAGDWRDWIANRPHIAHKR
ncbi:MAG: YrhB domain-containing protein [Kofleriaceae bacterium]